MELPVIGPAIPHLSEVTPALLNALDVPGFTSTVDIPKASRACVLLIDGLGWELLNEYAADAPVLSGMSRHPLRVGYPATTAAGLAAIGTGVASGEHGMTGYSFEVPGVGVLNALRWQLHPGGADLHDVLSPEQVQPLPTTFSRAAEAGRAVSIVSIAMFADSPLTRAVLWGGTYVGVHSFGDLTAATLAALQPAGSFCYAYHSELDGMGHLYGPGSAEWRMQLRHVDRLVETLLDELPEDCVLAVVSDHGMVEVDDTTVDFDSEPALQEGVRALAGEVRARHVHVEDGATADVLAAWRETLGNRAWVVERAEAIESGWFGPTVADHVRPRIGDLVVAARERSGVLRRTYEPVEASLTGHHGSLTTAEQLVPLALHHT